MAYRLTKAAADTLLQRWAARYTILAPRRMAGEGCFSDTDVVRYGPVQTLEEIEWEQKSDYSFKETLLPVNETLFYYTEDVVTTPKLPEQEILVFLRACDLHAVKRLDQIYLDNKFSDLYYARRREKTRFILMDCPSSCDTGFCASMGTNAADHYDAAVGMNEDSLFLDIKWPPLAEGIDASDCEWRPAGVKENREKVTLPKKLSLDSYAKDIWAEYGGRCIGCGRCNFVCPTCTCFTMQDIHYKDTPKVGERRRVWASCQVDGFTDINGGASFRKTQGERLRFKVMHKVHDFQERFGYTMCVGCGRCEAVCPEYISYIHVLNRLAKEEEG